MDINKNRRKQLRNGVTSHFEANCDFKEVITMLPEMFDETMFSNAEISEIIYYALNGEDEE